jgi:hypothetical protein
LSRDETLDRLSSPNWDFRREVLLSEPLTPEQRDVLRGTAAADDPRVFITEYTPNRVLLTAEMEQAGFLVLADPFCLGWHATVDGQPTKIIRANHALRGIFVGAGEHSVEFTFYPTSVVIGAVIAIGCCALELALLILSCMKRPFPPENRSGLQACQEGR